MLKDKRPTYIYSLFGLTLSSEIVLPELPAAQRGNLVVIDVWIRLCDESPDWPKGEDYFQALEADRQTFYWPEVAMFHFSSPHEITVFPRPGASDDLISFPLLGPVLGWLLILHGLTVLHASAARSPDGRGFVFMGDKGAGKSTTLSILVEAGFTILTDDIVAFRRDRDGFVILPGFAQIKIDEDKASRFAGEGVTFRPPPDPRIGKFRVLFPDQVQGEVTSDVRIFQLARAASGAAVAIVPFNGADALKSLLYFSFARRYDFGLVPPKFMPSIFEGLSGLAGTIAVGELTVPGEIRRLATLLPDELLR